MLAFGRGTKRSPGRTAAALAAAGVLLLALPGAAQDARQAATLARAEKKLGRAQERHEAAYAQIVAEYQAVEAWVAGTAQGPPPGVLADWLVERQVRPEEFAKEQERLAAGGPFHELWNTEIYRRSRAAREYAQASEELERSFLATERLRHPERFQRGFEKTPHGMALIPADRYTLGPSTGDLLEQPKVQKERVVRLRQFYLDRREVSCAEYARFLLAQPVALREEHLPESWGIDPGGAPVFPEGSGPLPVTGVTWVSAARFAEWAGKRLPTEEEWVAAAGGAERRRYPMGDNFKASKVNSLAFGAGGPRNPAEFAEDHTPLGVLCMTGNVREWTASGFDSKELRDPGPSTYAAVRGGSYLDDAEACHTSYRWLFPARERFPHVGFRCAKDVR